LVIEYDFFTSIMGGYLIPNLKFLASANLVLWPAGKKSKIYLKLQSALSVRLFSVA